MAARPRTAWTQHAAEAAAAADRLSYDDKRLRDHRLFYGKGGDIAIRLNMSHRLNFWERLMAR